MTRIYPDTLREVSTKKNLASARKQSGIIFPQQVQKLWRYRELAMELFWTHLKLRYVGSVLGFIWTMLNPMLYIATYWLVFSYIVRMGLPNYPLFLIPGFLAWNFTYGSLVSASESIIISQYLITKVAFPIEILTLVSVAVTLFDFLISLVLYLIAVAILPLPALPISAFGLPVIVLIQVLFTVGLSLLVACSSVFFRDIPKLVPVLGTILFFLTPVFYPLSFVPAFLWPVIQLNPMTQIVTVYHELLYHGRWPEGWLLGLIFLVALVVFGFGFWIFNRKKHVFAELC